MEDFDDMLYYYLEENSNPLNEGFMQTEEDATLDLFFQNTQSLYLSNSQSWVPLNQMESDSMIAEPERGEQPKLEIEQIPQYLPPIPEETNPSKMILERIGMVFSLIQLELKTF